MNLKQNIFRTILILVAFLHCFSFFNTVALDVEDIENYSIELNDIDANESDSEEKEEELKAFDYNTNKLNVLAIDLIQSLGSTNIVSHFLGKLQSPILANPYSPPEFKI